MCEVEEGTKYSSLERQEARLLLLSHLLGGNFAIWQPLCSTQHGAEQALRSILGQSVPC